MPLVRTEDRSDRSGIFSRCNESAQGVRIIKTGFPTGRAGSSFSLIRIVGIDQEQYERFMKRPRMEHYDLKPRTSRLEETSSAM